VIVWVKIDGHRPGEDEVDAVSNVAFAQQCPTLLTPKRTSKI